MRNRVSNATLRLPQPLSPEHCLSYITAVNCSAVMGKQMSPAQHLMQDYLFEELLSKYCESGSSKDRQNTAIQGFLDAERLCRRTNGVHAIGRPTPSGEWELNGILYLAQQKIFRLLGPFSWAEALEVSDFGPGASLQVRRSTASRATKFEQRFESYLHSEMPCLLAVARAPLWKREIEDKRPYFVAANRITTVPKNSRTDRVIAIEPSLAMYCQKGIGKLIRRRLKFVGVDLDDQSYNGELARLGSKFENLATIDLSAASDTIAYNLVRKLVPPDWFEAMKSLRAKRGVLPSGEVITYQKFSSMGNGYTFELESLIFWAISRAVLETLNAKDRRLGIYGDDIVISVEAVDLLGRVLSYAGFKLNSKKSHVVGPFRESCGKHYNAGVDVTPFYIRRPVNTLPELILLHNNYRRWLSRFGVSPDNYEVVRESLRDLRRLAHESWQRPTVPLTGGENEGFIGTFDEARPSLSPKSRKRGWSGYTVPRLSQVEILPEKGGTGRLLASLSSVREPGTLRFLEEPRRSTYKGRLVWVKQNIHILQWDDAREGVLLV